MKSVRASGAVVYSPLKKSFLLLKHREGHWEFPKGKLSPGEDDLAALRRELAEETGITEFKQLPFIEVIDYELRDRTHKVVVYYLVLYDGEVRLSDEHSAYTWQPYEDAYNSLKMLQHKDILRRAKQALTSWEEPEK